MNKKRKRKNLCDILRIQRRDNNMLMAMRHIILLLCNNSTDFALCPVIISQLVKPH